MTAAALDSHPATLAGEVPAVEIFAIFAVVAIAASTIYLLIDAIRGGHGRSYLEADATIMFSGWFAAGVSMQLGQTPWVSSGVVSMPWLIVCSLAAASLLLVGMGHRIEGSVALSSDWRTHDEP